MAAIRPSVVRSARDQADADDALQMTRERLLVGTADDPPKLAQYTGRGPLAAWVRVVAVREVLQAHRRTRRESSGDDTALVVGISSAASQELAMFRDRHAATFRSAVQQALRRLTAEQRALLRFSTRDGLTIDQLAPLLGVHRATAARRLERARTDALDATHAILCESHGLTASEARSLCLALAHEVDVSLGEALAEDSAR
jgi:RNA polymerase sigma-70 factor (ECF subfamily)